jgi:hypothetical protein
MKMVDLPSGKKLGIDIAPFTDSKALWQAMLEELKSLHLDPKADVDVNFIKDIFCSGISSKKVEACLWDCFKRVIYNDGKITKDTFESVEAREDYLDICFEVAKENIMPFTKNLSAKYQSMLKMLQNVQA